MRRAIAIAGGVLTIGLVFLAVWLAVKAFQLSSRQKLTVDERAATLQAVGGAAALIATIVLLGVTGWYAVLTASMLKQSGPIVSATLRAGWLYSSGSGALTAPFSTLGGESADDRYSVPMLAVVVRNSGNAGVEVVSVAVASDVEFSYSHPISPVGQSCPFTLAPHSSVTVYLSAADFAAAAVSWEQVMNQATRRARAVVELGSGVTVHSAWEATPHWRP